MEHRDVSPILKDLAPDYRFPDPPKEVLAAQQWLTDFWRFIGELLNNLHMPQALPADSSALGDLLHVLLVLLAVIAIIVSAFFVLRRLKYLDLQRRQAQGEIVDDMRLDAQGHRKNAEMLRARGDMRGAVRSLYMSVLLTLSERNIIDYAPTRTNYEYYYMLKADTRARHVIDRFRSMVDGFELVWYGFHDESEALYQTMLADLIAVCDATEVRS